MKKSIFLILLPCILWCFSGCKKSTTIGGTLYHGKIVNSICGQITVQFTDGTELGEMSWVDQTTTYDHVFKVGNPCTFNTYGALNVNDNIQFFIVVPETQSCMQCMALGHTPYITYSIRIIR